jgi:hypothetical protein
MTPADIEAQVLKLDTTSAREQEDVWEQLKPLGEAVVPSLAQAYPRFRTAQGRVSLVFHAIRHARSSDDAFKLGLAALRDKATLVRYRACGLLAYSLRKDALSHLKEALSHPDEKTAEDARAAITAIKKQNHHLFIDRDQSGRTEWVVNESDAQDTDAGRPWYKLW